mgnify:CR=1 FL=1
MDIGLRHQLKIAKKTLTLSDVGVKIMGGMTKDEAREIIRKHYGESYVKSLESD